MEGKALSVLLAELLNPVCFARCWVSSSSFFLLQFCNAFSSQILLLIYVFLVAHQNWVLYMICLSLPVLSCMDVPVPELAPEVVVICHDFSMYEYRTSRMQWLHFSSSAKRQ
jgi:hypothetical protein